MFGYSSRILFVGLIVFLMTGCNSRQASEGPVAVVVNLGLTAEAVVFDGQEIVVADLDKLLAEETKSHLAFATVSIGGDVPMEAVNSFMQVLRSSGLQGVHYTSSGSKQEFYPMTL
jgi:L-lactate utilization protein LutB